MAPVTGRWLVAPLPATGHPDDPVRSVAMEDPSAPRLEPAETGVVRVREAAAEAGPAATALVGRPRAGADGTSLIEVVVDGWRFELVVEDEARATLRQRAVRHRDASNASGPLEIRAIIPGRVAAVRVTAGDAVEAGDAVLVVEAMKMQNELRAPRAGTVERVAIAAGDTIELGDLLLVLR